MSKSALHTNHCAKCLLQPPPINFCRGIFHYTSPLNKLITNFKFHSRLDIGFSLATLLAREFEREYAGIPKPDLLIPVPLHRDRMRERGFNQAVEICRVVSANSSIPMSTKLIRKLKNTRSQTEIGSATKRKLNQQNAFFWEENQWPGNVNHVAIFDDVVTTMATVLSLANTLECHGIRHIDVWCLARATV